MKIDRDDAPPPRNQVYLADCNASDPYQQWEGSTFSGAGAPSTIKNLGNGECLNATIILPDGSNTGQNPMMVSPCDAKSYVNKQSAIACDSSFFLLTDCL